MVRQRNTGWQHTDQQLILARTKREKGLICKAKQGKWHVSVQMTLPNGKMNRLRNRTPLKTKHGAEQYAKRLRSSMNQGRSKS